MKETQRSRRIGRSIGALLIGIFAGAVLSFGTDELLYIAGIFPALGQPMNDALLLIATAHRTVYNVVGSYVVARLAPNPMQHAMATWNRGLASHWYPLAIIALAMPCAWAGGRLRVMQSRARVDGEGPRKNRFQNNNIRRLAND
jgi:TRAP-type C4-dicarboxylate transport system permease small subunit